MTPPSSVSRIPTLVAGKCLTAPRFRPSDRAADASRRFALQSLLQEI